MSSFTTIQVSRDVAVILHNRKELGQSYNDVIIAMDAELKRLEEVL